MLWTDLLIDGFNRVPEYVDRIMLGLSREDLKWQPKPDANSIGWLAWHLTRQHDAQVAELMEEDQLWIHEKLYEQFHRPADPSDTGFGDTPEQVAAFDPPDIAAFAAYLQATTNRTRQYILLLTPEDLDRELGGPWKPVPTVGVRLISIMEDAMIHAGQAAYIRGLLQGRGWQPY